MSKKMERTLTPCVTITEREYEKLKIEVEKLKQMNEKLLVELCESRFLSPGYKSFKKDRY